VEGEEEEEEEEEEEIEEVVVGEQQGGEADDDAGEEEEDDGSSWASNNASGGLPFVLAALGVIGLRDADDEPGLTSIQLQALHAKLHAALERLLALDCSSKLDHERHDDQQSSVHPRPSKRHRTVPPALATPSAFDQELLSRVMWYQAGQVRALRHACSNVMKLYERVRVGERLYESEEAEHSDENVQS
jgi:hypothetical protein